MDMELIKSIIALMKKNDLSEFDLEEKDFKLVLKRNSNNEMDSRMWIPAPVAVAPPAAIPSAPTAPVSPAAAPTESAAPVDTLPAILSPMVGTFYRSSSPDVEPFVKVGDHITKDSVVCIIEAMKVMNEIKAEITGTIQKILIENATAVQFGQKLFVVSPD